MIPRFSTSIDLDAPNLQWIGKRFLDSAGRVFRYQDHHVRAVYNEKVPQFLKLMHQGAIAELIKNGLILPQSYSPVEHEKYGLLLMADSAKWRIYGARYTFDAIKDAALTWLGMSRVLFKYQMKLIDGHFGNFVVYANRPHWVDMGSIIPLDDRRDGFEEFMHKVIYPLLVLKYTGGTAKEGRRMLHDGVRRDKLLEYIPAAKLRAGWSTQQSTALLNGASMERLPRIIALIQVVRALKLVNPDTTWSGYRDSPALDRAHTMDTFAEREDPRDATVVRTLLSMTPRQVLDVGANDGFHSILYARQGLDVLAVDRDEFAINKLYVWAKEHPELSIATSVDDFATTKYQADTVVSLALTHHLAIHGGMDFDVISRRYAQMSMSNLLVEFMPNGVGSTVVKPDPLPPHYRLQHFLDGLKRFFDQVEVVDYQRPPRFSVRTLIKCTGRNQLAA
jgi:Tellurite resistance protein TehB